MKNLIDKIINSEHYFKRKKASISQFSCSKTEHNFGEFYIIELNNGYEITKVFYKDQKVTELHRDNLREALKLRQKRVKSEFFGAS